MIKKIASGADAIVLDVKVGKGAFMRTLEEARALAEAMIAIGRQVGRRVTAVLSDMNQPLGLAVGNALEVTEAIAALRGEGPPDLVEHCLVVAAEMLFLGERAADPAEARRQLEALLADGSALERFRRWVRAQGGDPRVADDPSLLPAAPVVRAVEAPQGERMGCIRYVAGIDAEEVGLVSVALGAGRQRKGEPIDPAVGVVLGPKVGARVEEGERLFTVHARDERDAAVASERLLAAYTWADEPVASPPLIYDVIRGE